MGPITNHSLKEFQPTFQETFTNLMDAIRQVAKRNDGVVDMGDWFHRAAFDVPRIFVVMLISESAFRGSCIRTDLQCIERRGAASGDSGGKAGSWNDGFLLLHCLGSKVSPDVARDRRDEEVPICSVARTRM